MNPSIIYEGLLDVVARCGPAAVAFSGGADSSLLLKACYDVFGRQTRAFFANSVLQTPDDLNNAVSTADKIGVHLDVIEIAPLDWPQFVANPANRCYHCKLEVYSLFKALLPSSEMVLADGSNIDDLKEERPGHKAIEELGVLRPLVLAELDKSMVRKLGKHLDIPSWNRDSASCLATRIPEGSEITFEKLKKIEAYEQILIREGFKGCRVKLAAIGVEIVKIEVKKTDISVISRANTWKRITEKFNALGVSEIQLNLEGRG